MFSDFEEFFFPISVFPWPQGKIKLQIVPFPVPTMPFHFAIACFSTCSIKKHLGEANCYPHMLQTVVHKRKTHPSTWLAGFDSQTLSQ